MLECTSATHTTQSECTRSASSRAFGALPVSDAAFVSVVIPCFNEERFIERVLANLATQYDAARYEIIVVDGRSIDNTREVVREFAHRQTSSQVRLVDNPVRHIPHALNLGVRQARGDVIVRMDAHSIPSPNYVRRCVELLDEERADIVGMPWRIRPGADSVTAHAIALAVSHPFGIGDAKYRSVKASAQFVDTVPFGVFRKALWQELGGFNEDLLANEDYDFNYRARQKGHQILLDAAEHCDYFARATFTALARQNFRYGLWKAQMIKRHPRSIKLRQLVAPAFVSSVLLFTLLGLLWHPAWWALFFTFGSYTLLALGCALQLARTRGRFTQVFHIAFAFLVVHVAWGGGFLLGLVRAPQRASGGSAA